MGVSYGWWCGLMGGFGLIGVSGDGGLGSRMGVDESCCRVGGDRLRVEGSGLGNDGGLGLRGVSGSRYWCGVDGGGLRVNGDGFRVDGGRGLLGLLGGVVVVSVGFRVMDGGVVRLRVSRVDGTILRFRELKGAGAMIEQIIGFSYFVFSFLGARLLLPTIANGEIEAEVITLEQLH
ncbi:hypothetical protein RJT34_12625 [Clitoria ternatea]|uniref:Uncharacterized protein n=1 Tax=Clitoria ternatea TaxID=43366 RepID=A0AAN9JP47_CLITE